MTYQRSPLGNSLFEFMTDINRVRNAAIQHDDVTINRHRDNAASVEANKRAKQSKSEVRRLVWDIACSLGEFTSKEIAERLGRPINTFSGRITELKIAGLVVETEHRRNGCAVLRIARRDGQVLLF